MSEKFDLVSRRSVVLTGGLRRLSEEQKKVLEQEYGRENIGYRLLVKCLGPQELKDYRLRPRVIAVIVGDDLKDAPVEATDQERDRAGEKWFAPLKAFGMKDGALALVDYVHVTKPAPAALEPA